MEYTTKIRYKNNKKISVLSKNFTRRKKMVRVGTYTTEIS